MSIWSRLFGGSKPSQEAASPPRIPTVQFDPRSVTKTVKKDLRQNVSTLTEIPKIHHSAVYDAALRSILRGRDIGSLTKAILELPQNRISPRQAGSIAHDLNNKATALIQQERMLWSGIKECRWGYSGAPCVPSWAEERGAYEKQDETHKAANGRVFPVAEGLVLDGKNTWPGRENGCKCIARPLIKGFS